MQVFLIALVLAIALVSPTGAPADVVTDWNQTALRSTDMVNMSPPVQARVMAMVHAAIYDAVNAIDQRHAVYAVNISAPPGASMEAAAAAAAHGMLVRVFPPQQALMDTALGTSLAHVSEGQARTDGLQVGREVAEKLFALRKTDGADAKGEYAFGAGAGVYQRTPPMDAQPVLPQWRYIKPFMLKSAGQFALPGPPAPGSAAFAKELNEVKSLGAQNSSVRTGEQTAIAIFWAGSEVPPLNAVGRAAAAARRTSLPENARLFAYMNMAMADAFIAGFEAKYRFNSWRPITAIRTITVADNAAVAADPHWEPLLVTPPHPEYPCAHCFASGAAVKVFQEFFGSDAVSATYVYPPLGVLRRWESFSQIAQEMENARVWAGIHFRSAAAHGTRLGQQVAGYALTNYLQPLSKPSGADSLVTSPRKQ
jgi:hypothetical protein